MKHAKQKHTPGPWQSKIINKNKISVVNEFYIIAEGIQSGWDAELIAAAPEMLEALDLIFSIAGESYRSKQELQDAIQSYAIRAINKARGES